MDIRERLEALRDPGYRAFMLPLIPSVTPETVIGVRTPALRELAKEIAKSGEAEAFLAELPHGTFEENQLHAFLISQMRDCGACLRALEAFLPFVDNWATCDQMNPRVFRRHRAELAERVPGWLASGETYTVRFGIRMLMDHFLEEDYDPRYPAMVAAVPAEEYYVHMMVAWYFATALAKRWDEALPYLTERRLDRRTHNRAIQKAVESFRVPPERKAYLKSLRVR